MDSAISIKSKERVQEHGEVFTPDSIVNDMLDLTDKEIKGVDTKGNILDLMTPESIKEYIDKTYLEPSCGNGNFLMRILDRKLNAVQKLPLDEQDLWLVHAVSSIYGVDIQGDNVEESKSRMMELIKTGNVNVLDLPSRETQPWHFKAIELTQELEKVIKFILDRNIQHGNCLTGNKWLGLQETTEPMIFVEYKWRGTDVTCIGHTLEDIEHDSKEDRLENNCKYTNYMNIQTLNFKYSDKLDEDEEF
mgnify:CR=1 FL=1|jgi:hypothetical protein